jgi:hypothetical protein
MTFSRETITAIEEAALAAWNEEKQQTFRYRFSSAGGPCIRMLCFEALGAKNEMKDVRHGLMAALGQAAGNFFEAGNKKLGWTTQEHVELPDCEVLVAGSLDAADAETVLDYKLVNDKQWKRVATAPRFKDQFQVNAYAVSTKRPFWALAYLRGSSIFDQGSKLDWKIFSGKAEPGLAASMALIWERVDEHTKAKTLPPIPADFKADRFPCGWKTGACPHFKECWDGR